MPVRLIWSALARRITTNSLLSGTIPSEFVKLSKLVTMLSSLFINNFVISLFIKHFVELHQSCSFALDHNPPPFFLFFIFLFCVCVCVCFNVSIYYIYYLLAIYLIRVNWVQTVSQHCPSFRHYSSIVWNNLQAHRLVLIISPISCLYPSPAHFQRLSSCCVQCIPLMCSFELV